MARTTATQREAARRDLLEMAARHFAEHGFDGANVNAIATEAGFAKGTIYNHFASKAELLTAVLEHGSEATAARFRRRQSNDLRTNLLALTEEDVAIVRDHEPFMRAVMREMLSARPETRQAVDKGLEPFETAVTELLEDAARKGEVESPLDPQQLGRSYAALLMALYVERWRSDGDWPTWDEIPTVAVSVFLDGAAGTGTQAGEAATE